MPTKKPTTPPAPPPGPEPTRPLPAPVPPVVPPKPAPEPSPISPTTAPAVGNFADAGQPATLDKYNAAYVAAAVDLDVPPNVIKAVHATENGWGHEKLGTQNCTVRPSSGCLNLWTGIFETTAESHDIDYPRTLKDPTYAIWSVGKVLSAIAAWGAPRVVQTILDGYGWRGVVAVYFGGEGALSGDFVDEMGRPSSQYVRDVWIKVDALGGESPGQPSPQPARDPLAVIMGGRYDVTYEWAVDSDLGYYQYGQGHGLNGRQHTGIDVAGNLGQPMFSPGAGVVTCAGTGNGPGSWGTGCAAFADLMGHGAGRVEIMLDSGVSVILGHSSEALVRAGQRVAAGDKVATCGGMNGPHVHVEARIAGPNVYTIVDPRKHLKGQPGPPPPPQFSDLPDWCPESLFLLALPDARPSGPVTELVIAWMKQNGRLPWKLTEVETADGWVYVMTDMVITSDGQTARIIGVRT